MSENLECRVNSIGNNRGKFIVSKQDGVYVFNATDNYEGLLHKHIAIQNNIKNKNVVGGGRFSIFEDELYVDADEGKSSDYGPITTPILESFTEGLQEAYSKRGIKFIKIVNLGVTDEVYERYEGVRKMSQLF